MSLDWNYRSVGAEGQAMINAAWIGAEGDQTNPALDSVIWSTIAIGLGNWTAANMPTVQKRMAIYQHINGPAITFNDGRAYYVTPDELAKLEGFHTNVTKITDAAFGKKVMGWLEEEAARTLRRGGPQYLGEGGADMKVIGAFEAQANAAAERKAKEASKAGSTETA